MMDFNLKEEELFQFNDQVNSPSHYTAGGIETIDYIKAKLTKEEYMGYLKGSILKYTSRAGKKLSELEDFKKARWYIDKIIEEVASVITDSMN
jgi:hypothetical protein